MEHSFSLQLHSFSKPHCASYMTLTPSKSRAFMSSKWNFLEVRASNDQTISRAQYHPLRSVEAKISTPTPSMKDYLVKARKDHDDFCSSSFALWLISSIQSPFVVLGNEFGFQKSPCLLSCAWSPSLWPIRAAPEVTDVPIPRQQCKHSRQIER